MAETQKRRRQHYHREEFGPFELKFDFMFTEGANSGIKYGLAITVLVDWNIRYLTTKSIRTPKTGLTETGHWLHYDLIPANKEARFISPDEWNRAGLFFSRQSEHWLNGRKG